MSGALRQFTARKPAATGSTPVPGIGGIRSWLDADQITGLANGATVALWPDASGNGRDAQDSPFYSEPTYHTNVQNGLPVVRFNGPPEALEWTDTAAEYTLFVAYQRVRGIRLVSSYEGGGGVDGPEHIVDFYGGDFRYLCEGRNINGGTPGSAFTYITARSGASGGLLRAGGTVIGSSTTVVPAAQTFYIAEDFEGPGGNNEYFEGDIGELILYDGELSATEIADVESYLVSRWAI